MTDIRDEEVEGLRFIGMIKSLNQSVSLVGPALVSFVTFLTMIALNQELTASVAFTVLSLYNVARYPLSTLPLSIKAYAGKIFGKTIAEYQKILRPDPQFTFVKFRIEDCTR